MKYTIQTAVLTCTAALLLASGCTGTQHVAGETTPASNEAMTKVKSLAGTWEMKGEDGKMQVASVYRITSGGTVVCETMFPGTPHEMTNMYHLDGDGVVATHYCSLGNQPRMRCTSVSGNQLVFVPLDCTNLKTPGESHMAQLTLVMTDDAHLRQQWISRKDGVDGERADFDLVRK